MDFFVDQKEGLQANGKWNILVSDDEPQVLQVTKLLLKHFEFEGKRVNILEASSGAETIKILKEREDIALVILDVIMESEQAGLDVVKELREDLDNEKTQIILRTGYPGQHPHEEVIRNYKINDYKTKTELSQNKMITSVISALRTYQALDELKELNNNLSERVEERTREIAEKNEELHQLIKTKDKLFRLMSHDLRGPINNFQGLYYLIKDAMASNNYESLTKLADMVFESAQGASKLLDELVSWALLEEGQHNLNMEQQPLLQVVKDTFDVLSGQAQAKLIRLHMDVPATMQVFGDRNGLLTILRNIVSNAIKFTPEQGEIKVVAVEQGDEVYITISDTGQGMSPEVIDRLFKGANQSSAGTKGEKGFGLGLKITYDFIKRHQGRIDVTSDEGKGTTFHVYLPTKEPVASGVEVEASAS